MNPFRNLPKEKKQKVILVGIASIAAAAVILQFHVLQQTQSLVKARNDVGQLRDELATIESKVRAMKGNEKLLEQMRGFVDTQQARMASGDAFAWMVREMSLLAEQHPIHLVSMNPGSDGARNLNPNKGPTTFTMRIEITGTYDQVGRFVSDLENKFPTGQLRSLEVAGNATGPGGHQASLNITVPVRPEQPVRKEKATS